MNIPGFTAETSLYRESGHYRMAGAHTHAYGTIQPASFYRHHSDLDCYFKCSDVCGGGIYVYSAVCRPGRPPECICW